MADRVITEEQLGRVQQTVVSLTNIALEAVRAIAAANQVLVEELGRVPPVEPEPPRPGGAEVVP